MKKKKNINLMILISLISFFIILIIFGNYTTEFSKKPIVKEKVEQRDIGYLYNFYFLNKPNINGRSYYGNPNASITTIVYIDMHSNSSKTFFNETMPYLLQEYIYQNKVKYYHKYFVTLSDIEEKNDNFIFSQALACFEKTDADFFDFYLNITSAQNKEEILKLAETYNIDNKEFETCLNGEVMPALIEDASEIENFGMVGINPRIYIGFNGNDNTVLDGIPSQQRLRRILINYQVQIGD